MAKKKKDASTPSILAMLRRYLQVNRRFVGLMILSMGVTLAASLFVGLRSYYFGRLVDDANAGLIKDFVAVLPILLAQLAYIPLEIGQGLLSATFSNRSVMAMRLCQKPKIWYRKMI